MHLYMEHMTNHVHMMYTKIKGHRKHKTHLCHYSIIPSGFMYNFKAKNTSKTIKLCSQSKNNKKTNKGHKKSRSLRQKLRRHKTSRGFRVAVCLYPQNICCPSSTLSLITKNTGKRPIYTSLAHLSPLPHPI